MENHQTVTLTDGQLWEIIGDLQVGNRIFYNKKSGETKSLIDLDSYGEVIEEMVDEWKEVESNWHDYVEITNMDSTKAFELMEDFLEEVDDVSFKSRLTDALNRRKPFANFKMEIENSADYREKWFKFRDQKMKEFVLAQLDRKIKADVDIEEDE
ncbi:MAG TPA: UPF0158 family protein [Cytophagaceae bacterium]|jgi:hypothetical protein